MNTLTNILFYTHIISGGISLILFWIAICTRKGSTVHRKVGRYYVNAMWIVVFTAMLLSVHNLISGAPTLGFFLGFLALLTANPLWHGVASLEQKRTVSLSYRRKSLQFELALGLAGLMLCIYAFSVEHQTFKILMIIFGVLGMLSLPRAVSAWRTPQDKINWTAEHIEGMFSTGIAAYTAFFAFGGRTLFQDWLPGMWMVVPWITPAIIGTIGIRWAVQHMANKPSDLQLG
jgi:uncharacterized membrane protein